MYVCVCVVFVLFYINKKQKGGSVTQQKLNLLQSRQCGFKFQVPIYWFCNLGKVTYFLGA